MRAFLPALVLLLTASTTFGQTETTKHMLGRKDEDGQLSEKSVTLELPSTWKVVEREDDDKENGELAKMTVPGANGADAVFTVYDFGRRGGVKTNIDRWVGMFPEDGRDDEVTVHRGTVESLSARYFIIELTGTYKEGEAADSPAEENYSLTGVVLGVPGEGVFFLELIGPKETVGEQRKAITTSFTADEKEFPVKLEDL